MEPSSAASAKGAAARPADAKPGWLEAEPPLFGSAFVTSVRLLGRARDSWAIWIAVVALACAGVIYSRFRHPPPCTTTVVLRLVEGNSSSSSDPITTSALGAYINDLAFSRAHLLELAGRHLIAFPKAGRDPDRVVDDLREGLSVAISDNDFIDSREPGQPPRSVRIEVSFTTQQPELAAAVARELADLLVTSEIGRERHVVEREAVAWNEAQSLSAEQLQEALKLKQEIAAQGLTGVTDRARAVLGKAVAARLNLRSAEDHQALRFEVVDGGSEDPTERGIVPAALPVLAALPLLVVVAALLAGALDPRLLDEMDAREAGVPILGYLPRSV